MTVKQFADYWLTEFPRESNSSNKRYTTGIKSFVKAFGSRDIASITRVEAVEWAQKNPRSNVRIVQSMFSDAYNSGHVKHNPLARLRLVQSRGRKDVKPPTADGIDELAAISMRVHGVDYGLQFAKLIKFAAYSGIRLAELLALEVEHIDRVNDEIHVVQHIDDYNVLQPGGKGGLERTVVLLPEAKRCIMSAEYGVLFTNRAGNRITKTTHYVLWDKVRKQFDPTLQFHSLRHFTATYLLNLGATPESIAVQLGHIDRGGRPNTTLVLSTYGHPQLERERQTLKDLVNAAAYKNLRRQQTA